MGICSTWITRISPHPDPIVVSTDALEKLVSWYRASRLGPALIVADARTSSAWPLDEALRSAGVQAFLLILPGEPRADEASIERIKAVLKPGQTPLALGSGTITDVVRYVAAEAGIAWVSVPTAPSVDGFVSAVAAMTLGGAKLSTTATSPAALFADPRVLTAAPRPLIAAGAGDILGKFTSVADWKLGSLLYDEPFSPQRAERSLAAARSVASVAPAIGQAEPKAVVLLMDALLDSGLVMLDQGDSRSASGTEHHIAHVWEMKLIREGRPPILHGAKVGVAAILAARLWERLRKIDAQKVEFLADKAVLSDPEKERKLIEDGFGSAAKAVLKSRRNLPYLDQTGFQKLLKRIVSNWGLVQEIARTVPKPEEIEALLAAAGAPVRAEEIGLSEAEVADALRLCRFLRDRFTVARLLALLQREFPADPV